MTPTDWINTLATITCQNSIVAELGYHKRVDGRSYSKKRSAWLNYYTKSVS